MAFLIFITARFFSAFFPSHIRYEFPFAALSQAPAHCSSRVVYSFYARQVSPTTHSVCVVGQRFPPLYLVGIFIFGEKPGVLNKNTSRAQHSISAINIFCAIYVHFCAHSIVDLVTCMGAVKYLCSFTCCTCS